MGGFGHPFFIDDQHLHVHCASSLLSMISTSAKHSWMSWLLLLLLCGLRQTRVELVYVALFPLLQDPPIPAHGHSLARMPARAKPIAAYFKHDVTASGGILPDGQLKRLRHDVVHSELCVQAGKEFRRGGNSPVRPARSSAGPGPPRRRGRGPSLNAVAADLLRHFVISPASLQIKFFML